MRTLNAEKKSTELLVLVCPEISVKYDLATLVSDMMKIIILW